MGFLDAMGGTTAKITAETRSSGGVIPYRKEESMGTRAFWPHGTKATIAGRKLAELVSVYLLPEGIECICNFIPADEGQQFAIRAMQERSYPQLDIELPNGSGLKVIGQIDGKVSITVCAKLD